MTIYNFEYLKDYAKRTRQRVEELIALAPKNDPFYMGMPNHRRNAEWFAQAWERFGYTTGIHIRRVHYRVISQDPAMNLPTGVTFKGPDGTRSALYLNTEACWLFMEEASKAARYLDFVDPSAFVDRRNPETVVNVEFERIIPGVYINDDYDLGASELPGFPNLPDYAIGGYVGQQRYMLELWCEKSTMNDILVPLCERYRANLVTGLGELSITKALEVIERRIQRINRPTRIGYASDFDIGGRSMPVAVARKIEYFLRKKNLEGVDVRLEPIVLTLEQIRQYRLPRTPIKDTEKRKDKFEDRFGEGAVELDALEALHPGALEQILTEWLNRYYDRNLQARVFAERARLLEDLDDIRNEVILAYQGEIERLEEQWETIRNEFGQRVKSHNTDLRRLFDSIGEKLREQIPDLAGYPIPEAAEADETDSVLYDSRRDYFEQLDAYKKFQGKNGRR